MRWWARLWRVPLEPSAETIDAMQKLDEIRRELVVNPVADRYRPSGGME